MRSRDREPSRDDRIERYLLGRLPDRERAPTESSLFEDEAFYEEVREVEDTLIDRYMAGELSPDDREAFERHFANSPSRRERIAFARTLATAPVLPEGVHAAAGAPSGVSPARLDARVRIPRAAWTAVAATLLMGALWLAGRGPFRQAPSPLSGSPLTGPLPVGSPPPDAREPSASPEIPPEHLAVLLRLQPDILRSSGAWPRLSLPLGAPTARLEADLEGRPSRGTYTAILHRASGSPLWQGPATIDEARGKIRVDVPGSVFEPGDYVVTFNAPGGRRGEGVDYVFVVRGSRGASSP
jgi:hypothetical protein